MSVAETVGAKPHRRGHPIAYDAASRTWKYADTGEVTPRDRGAERPCVKCGLTAEPGGPDPCLGWLPGVASACCGHGVGDAYRMAAPSKARVRRERLREVISHGWDRGLWWNRYTPIGLKDGEVAFVVVHRYAQGWHVDLWAGIGRAAVIGWFHLDWRDRV